MSYEFIFQIWRRYHEKWDFPETIYSPPPPPTFEEKYLFTKCIEEFYKLLNYFSHYTYPCMLFNYTIIIDRILDIISDLFDH